MCFKQDLKLGQIKENEFAALLTIQGWTTTSSTDLGKFNGYDILAVSGTTATTIHTVNNATTTTTISTSITTTYEIKFDLKASCSGNIAVEVCRRGYNDKKIPSGLSASTADYYVFCIDGDDKFYQIKTSDLINLVNEKKYHSGFWGGDYKQSGIVLFNRDFLFSKCG